MSPSPRRFTFDGDATGYARTALLNALVTVGTLGIAYPFAFVRAERWRAEHSSLDGEPLAFSGTARDLFGLWIRCLLLSVVTLGVYAFWAVPRLTRWRVEHTTVGPFAPADATSPALAAVGSADASPTADPVGDNLAMPAWF
jgi:uncharacterized membrane protein YjgN (DUF898 family)